MEQKIEGRAFFRKKDIIVVAIIFLALFSYNFIKDNIPGSKAEIIYDGQVIDTISLSKDLAINYNVNPEVVFEISDGSIRFFHSDCPDKICVNTGFIQYLGESAACLPNKTIVRIIKGEKNPVDAVSR